LDFTGLEKHEKYALKSQSIQIRFLAFEKGKQ